MSSLLDMWHEIAYEDSNQQNVKKVFTKYFKEEKEVYKSLLSNVQEEVVGTVKDLSERFNMDQIYFVGFLEGINESIKNPNPIEKLKESSKVKIKIEPEKLFYNMVKAKAHWLYNLEEWNNILSEEKRKELIKTCHEDNMIRREGDKVYPNDPCPCGSGKKYKKCCGKSA